jgi:hypothetical protein
MNHFESLLENQTVKPTFNKEQWAKEKNENRKKAFETIALTSVEVGKNPQMFQKFLDVQSQFELYSSNNALLILAQRPNATMIKDPTHWKKTRTYINKGEKPFIILGPGKAYQREDGTTGMNYEPKKVFDVSQTNYRKNQKDKPVKLDAIIKAMLQYSPAIIDVVDSLPNGAMSTYNSISNEITLQRGLPTEIIIASLAQEMTHAEMANNNPNYERSKANFHAYCTSYMIAKKFGLDTSHYDFKSVSSVYQDLEAQEITNDLASLHAVHKPLCERINKNLYKMEKGKEHSLR